MPKIANCSSQLNCPCQYLNWNIRIYELQVYVVLPKAQNQAQFGQLTSV